MGKSRIVGGLRAEGIALQIVGKQEAKEVDEKTSCSSREGVSKRVLQADTGCSILRLLFVIFYPSSVPPKSILLFHHGHNDGLLLDAILGMLTKGAGLGEEPGAPT